MSMTAEQVHRAFTALDPDRIQPGLSRTLAALAALGNPHQAPGTRWILVAGTNGKGSTSAFLDSILRAAGHRVGLYTSPHLVRVNERMKVDGLDIPDTDFARIGARVLAFIAGGPTLSYFEALTVLAFAWFAERQVELGVLEVGLGGRLDATNVVTPTVSIVTTIGYDHTDWLGNDLVTIAREKAGVIRPGGVVVSGLPDDLHDAAVVPAVAGGRIVRAGHEVRGELEAGRYDYRGLYASCRAVSLGIPGSYQASNATLAAAAAELVLPGLDPATVQRGLEQARWPGRYELLPDCRPRILLDGAHNEAGARALAASLTSSAPGGRLILVTACRKDKDPAAILAPLWPHLHAAIVTTIEAAKLRPTHEVAAAAAPSLPGGVFEEPDVAAAIQRARAIAGPDDTILVAGSLYLVGAVRAATVSKA